MITNGKWEYTDPDTQQYGREISEFVWEYKQPDVNGGEPEVIDMRKYTVDQIESAINTFGYTLGSNGNYKLNIWQEYKLHALQIICECLFELEEGPIMRI